MHACHYFDLIISKDLRYMYLPRDDCVGSGATVVSASALGSGVVTTTGVNNASWPTQNVLKFFTNDAL